MRQGLAPAAGRAMRRIPYWWPPALPLASRMVSATSSGPDSFAGALQRARGSHGGPAARFSAPNAPGTRRSPPDAGRRSVDGAMSPAGRVTGSRPITHGCSVRDRRSGSPLQPFATVVRSMVRGRRLECPRLCRVTAHPNNAPRGARLGMAGMSRGARLDGRWRTRTSPRTNVPGCRFIAAGERGVIR